MEQGPVCHFSSSYTIVFLTKSSVLDRLSTSYILVACITGVIKFFFAFLQESEGKREVSEKRQTSATGKTQKKQRPVHIPLLFCIPPQKYPLMALLTRFALAFTPASGLIAFARLKNARLLCRLAS